MYMYQHRLILNNSRLLQTSRDYQRNHNSNIKYKILTIESKYYIHLINSNSNYCAVPRS